MLKLYMNGVMQKEDGSEADFVEVEEDQKYALYAMGWRESESAVLPSDE